MRGIVATAIGACAIAVGPSHAQEPAQRAPAVGTIRIPGVANLAFGDRDGKTIYFMARRDLYRMRVNAAGIRPMSQPAR